MIVRTRILLSATFALLLLNSASFAQHRPKPKVSAQPQPVGRAIELFGIRPGLAIDSVQRALGIANVRLRSIPSDSVTNTPSATGLDIFVVDSIFCRLTYMRMVFVFDHASRHLRRFAITPRLTAIAAGQNDDIDAVLLLYFSEIWGAPRLHLEPPACWKWSTGNIEVRGYVRRGSSLWVLEG